MWHGYQHTAPRLPSATPPPPAYHTHHRLRAHLSTHRASGVHYLLHYPLCPAAPLALTHMIFNEGRIIINISAISRAAERRSYPRLALYRLPFTLSAKRGDPPPA